MNTPPESGTPDPFAASKDPFGARMKTLYEFPSRHFLPKHAYTAIRVDGKNFSSYTKGLEKPFDLELVEAFAATMKALCAEIAGAEIGYHQSDEISLILTDFSSERTEPWYGGNLQKLASVSASMATAVFNDVFKHPTKSAPALFDARAFSIPSQIEAANYALWRQQDAYRNAISMVGQANFSPRQLDRVSTAALKELLQNEHGIDADALPQSFLRGQVAERVSVMKPVEYFDKSKQETVVTDPVSRRVWEVRAAPDFSGLDWLRERLPDIADVRPQLSESASVDSGHSL